MSRTDEFWNNSVFEFFGRPKEDLIHGRSLDSHAEAGRAIDDYIDTFSSLQTIQKILGYLRPRQVKNLYAAAENAA